MISSSDILNASLLVVDDQEANVRLLERMLRGAGYTAVASTMEPREVCELHRRNHYSLILLDLLMPGLDGLEAIRRIRTEIVDAGQPWHVTGSRPRTRRPDRLAGFQERVRDFQATVGQVAHQGRDPLRIGRRRNRPIHRLFEPGARNQLHRPRDLADVADRFAPFIECSGLGHLQFSI